MHACAERHARGEDHIGSTEICGWNSGKVKGEFVTFRIRGRQLRKTYKDVYLV